MFSKNKNSERNDPEHREQYDYARKRVKQKKRLMRHFILFLAGSILLIIINPVLGIGKEFFIKNWFVWAILIWALLFLVHLLNVFIMNKFMGKEWEDRQMEKLKAQQETRIAELKKQAVKEVTVSNLSTGDTPQDSGEAVPLASDEEPLKKKRRRAHQLPSGRSMITMIAAAGENKELGKDNDLVWHLPDDFKRFKQLTTGHHIIMGRKTFESFPKLLPNRTQVIISRNKEYKKEGTIVVRSMEEAILEAANDPQVFIIGGGEIYALGMKIAHKIEVTRVHGTFEADAFFPEIPLEEWELVSEKYHSKDEQHAFAFTYETWVRR